MSTNEQDQGVVVIVDQQPVHEMSDPDDPEMQRSGGNARDGGRWQALVTPETVKDANLIAGVYSLRPGETHLLHYHETAAEFYYVLSGTGKFTLGDRIVRGEPGVMVYMPPHVNHAVTNDGDEDFNMIFCFDCGDVASAKMIWVEDE